LADEFHVRRFAATRTCAGKFKQRCSKLRIFYVGGRINHLLFGFNFFNREIPICPVIVLRINRNHFQCRTVLITRTNIGTVLAAHTIQNIHLNAILQAFKLFARNSGKRLISLRCFRLFFRIQQERTNSGVRTNISALITLTAIFGRPNGNVRSNTALFVNCRPLIP